VKNLGFLLGILAQQMHFLNWILC